MTGAHKPVFQNHQSFLRLAKSRKTTYEFSSKQIKKDHIISILEAARWAPSCDNSQPWNFIVIKNKETITKLLYTTNSGAFHTSPPLLIAIVLLHDLCSIPGHSCFRGDGYDRYDPWLSAAMPALNMVYEAETLSIASCFLTPEREKASKILKLKKKDIIALLIGFGYEKKKAFQKPKQRRELEEITHKEFFGQPY